MSQTPYADFIALANPTGIRHVRTPEGAAYFHLPVGSVITEAEYQAIKAEHKAAGHAWPKGMTTKNPNLVHTGGTGNAAANAVDKVQDAEEAAAAAAKKNLIKTPKAPHSSAPHSATPHSAAVPHTPVPKFKPSPVVKSSISGPNKFSVGTVEFSAPVGSRLYTPTANTGIKFVITPDNQVHAFNSQGELKLDNGLITAALAAKFTPEFQGDQNYSVGAFDSIPGPGDLPNESLGATLNDVHGVPQFTKTGPDEWTHSGLGIAMSTADVLPFVSSGELTVAPATTPSNDPKVHLDLSSLDQPTFYETLQKFPAGKKLYFKGQTLTKNKNGLWSGDKTKNASEKELWYLKNNLSDSKEESNTPAPAPATPEVPAAATEAPATPEAPAAATEAPAPTPEAPAAATPPTPESAKISEPSKPDAATPPAPPATATAEAPNPKKVSDLKPGDVLTADTFYKLPGDTKISVQNAVTGESGSYTYVPKSMFNKTPGWRNDKTNHVIDAMVFHSKLNAGDISLLSLGGKDAKKSEGKSVADIPGRIKITSDKSLDGKPVEGHPNSTYQYAPPKIHEDSKPKAPSTPFPEPKVVHKDSLPKMVPAEQPAPKKEKSLTHDQVLTGDQLDSVPIGHGVTIKHTPSSGSGTQASPTEYRKTSANGWKMVKKTPESNPPEVTTQKVSTYGTAKNFSLHYNEHPSEDAKAAAKLDSPAKTKEGTTHGGTGSDSSGSAGQGGVPQGVGAHGAGSVGPADSGSNGGGVVLADGTKLQTLGKIEPNARVKQLAKEGLKTPDIYELNPSDAAAFHAAISAMKENNNYHASVYVYPVEDYAKMRLFMTPDGKGGIALKGDEIVSVFVHSDSMHKGSARALLATAVGQGGKRLDAFDTVLPQLYAQEGFVPVARTAWNDQFAPEGWDKATYAKYNNGSPDVVFMVHSPGKEGSDYVPGAGQTVGSYDAGEALSKDAAKNGIPHTSSSEIPVGEKLSSVAQMEAMKPGSVLAFEGKSGTTHYAKLPNGNILNPNGQQFLPATFEKAIKDGKFTIHSYPTESGAAGGDGIQLVPGGQHYTHADLSAALKALESHSSFQISYGLKSLDPTNQLHESHDGTQKELKIASASEFPNLKSKPAAIAYLKRKLGVEAVPAATPSAATSDAPKIEIKAGDTKHEFTAAEIQAAISILDGYQGKLWANELSKKGSPLGDMKWNDVIGFHKDKAQGKKTALKLLHSKLDNAPAAPEAPKAEKPAVLEPPVPKGYETQAPAIPSTSSEPKVGDVLTWEQFQKLPEGAVLHWENSSGMSTPYDATQLKKGEWTPSSSGKPLSTNLWKTAIEHGYVTLKSLPGDTTDEAPKAPETKASSVPNTGDTLNFDQFQALAPNSQVVFHLPSGDKTAIKQSDGHWILAEDSTQTPRLADYFKTALSQGKGELVSKPGDLPAYAEAPAAVQSKPDVAEGFNQSGILPGRYTKEGDSGSLFIHADGSGTLTGPKGTAPVDSATAKIMYDSGFNQHQGIVDSTAVEAASVVTPVQATPAPKKPAAKKNSTKKTPLPEVKLSNGTYYLGSPGTASSAIYTVKDGQVTVTKANGDVSTVPVSKLKTNFYAGKILDGNGNSVVPEGHTGSITMWNSPMTVPALQSAKTVLQGEDVAFFNKQTQNSLALIGFQVPFSTVLKKVQKANPDYNVGSYWDLQNYSNAEDPANVSAKQIVLDQLNQFLDHVDTSVPESNTSALFDWGTNGEAIMPPELVPLVSTAINKPYDSPSQTAAFNAIKKHYGNGKIIGQGVTKANDKHAWTVLFSQGNFQKMYQGEVKAFAQKEKPHPAGYLHPGYEGNTATNQITWGAAVPGEVSASAANSVPGNWSDVPVGDWSLAEVQNYLISAQMQHPEHLNGSEQRQWVLDHKAGKKIQTDALSVLAKTRADSGTAALSAAPVWTNDIKPAKVYDHLFDSTPFPTTQQWSASPYSVSQAWAKDNWTNPDFQNVLKENVGEAGYKAWGEVSDYSSWKMEAAVGQYFDQKNAEYQAELLKPVYSYVKPLAGGSHEVHLYKDQFGKQYVFKPMEKPSHLFRVEAEIAGNKLGQFWGYGSAHSETKKLEVPNSGEKTGIFQDFIPSVSDFSSSDGKVLDISTLSDKQLGQMAAEHVLDWALDNDDTHSENLLLTQDGNVVGIDKGRAFRVFGNWKGITGDTQAHTNASIIYTKLYNGIRDGSISPEQAQAAYFGAMKAAKKIQNSSDASVSAIVAEGVAHRTNWAPPDYMTHFDHSQAPQNAEDLIKAVLDRKNQMTTQIQGMWEKIYKDAGLGALPEPPAYALGEQHLSGWQEPHIMDKVAETKAWGSAPVHASSNVVEGHSLLWTEQSPSGDTLHVGSLKVGHLAQQKLLGFLQPKVGTTSDTLTLTHVPQFPSTQEWKSSISAAAKDITKNSIDKNFDPEVQKKFQDVSTAIHADSAHFSPTLTPGDNGLIEFPSGNSVPASGLDQYQLALQHYQHQIDLVEKAKEQGVTTNKGDFTLFTPIAYAPQPETYTHPELGKYTQLSSGSYVHAPSDGQLAIVPSLPSSVTAQQDGWSKVGEAVQSDPVKYKKMAASMSLGSMAKGGVKTVTGPTTSGNSGKEYQITLPTGENIFFRNASSTGTDRSQHGLIRFQLASGADPSASLARVEQHLNTMGLDLAGANEEDAQSVYWRQMFNRVILSNTSSASAAVKAAREQLVGMLPDLRKSTGDSTLTHNNIIEAIGATMTTEAEHAFWKNLADNTFGADKVNAWLGAGKHLPQYQHMDLANPESATGHAYWNRIDVSKEDLQKKNTLIAIGNNGKDTSLLNYLTTGGMLSTEERYRVVGLKTGASSSSDQGTGGATGVFTRIAVPGTGSEKSGALFGEHVAYWNPGVLQQTGTYSYTSDEYGNTENQVSNNKFNPLNSLTQNTNTSNETLIQHQLSILDNLEIMVFQNATKRNEAIQIMKSMGHDTLRGVPIEDRLIMKSNLAHAIQVVKAAWQQ